MWWLSWFDATLGFPGEGPPPPRIAMSPIGRPADGEWLAKASRVLQGAEAFTGQGWIAEGLSAGLCGKGAPRFLGCAPHAFP
jgi:hypothetical protein